MLTYDEINGHRLETHYTVRQLANAFGLCTKTIRRKVALGEIGVIRIGRSVRIPLGEIKRWAASQRELLLQKIDDLGKGVLHA